MNSENTTTVSTSKMVRWNGRCARKACKRVVSILGSSVKSGGSVFVVTSEGARFMRYGGNEISVPCSNCNADPRLVGLNGYHGETPVPYTIVCKRVVGVVRPEIVCSTKCTGAMGHDCQCSCGGKNHGAGHSAK